MQLSASRIRAYRTCPRLYSWKFREHRAILGPRPIRLSVGNAVHAVTARMCADMPRSEADVIDLAAQAVVELGDQVDSCDRDIVIAEAAQHLLDYWRRRDDLHIVGKEHETETWLRAVGGPHVLISRADVLWRSDWDECFGNWRVANSLEWKISTPPSEHARIQTVFAHAGIRAHESYRGVDEVRHWRVTFRPEPRLERVHLTENAYRETLRQANKIACEVARTRQWEPNASAENCAYCEYGLCCDAAEAHLLAMPY